VADLTDLSRLRATLDAMRLALGRVREALALLELMCRLPENGIADDGYSGRALGLLKEAELVLRGSRSSGAH
jgi:hypothetical protein